MNYDVIVLGTGGVGSAALFHAARQGARVTALDLSAGYLEEARRRADVEERPALAAGRQPLITSVALAARPATPDYLLRYSRRLTQLWTGIFIAMTLWDLALALFAPREAWSFMANGANYLVIGATVTIEYIYRRWRFRDYSHPGFVEYLRIVVTADPRRMREP
jgi:glycine/D-amino acid oxidase-like deaminating enzyme